MSISVTMIGFYDGIPFLFSHLSILFIDIGLDASGGKVWAGPFADSLGY